MGKTYMGVNRTTFVINEKGVIRHIITKVDTDNATAQVLELIEQ
jgi:peroxiredoxin Q/BCP